MAVRRTRPPQPLAPHGSRASGRVRRGAARRRHRGRTVGDRRRRPGDGRRSGSVTARCCARGSRARCCAAPTTATTYDAMFDLWFPAALGARTVGSMTTMTPTTTIPTRYRPRTSRRCAPRCVEMLADNADLANMDDRLAAMIAQIVEAYGRYNSSRGPVVLVVSGAQGDGTGRTRGQAARRAARALRRRADADAGADRQGDCRQADRAAAPDGRGGDQAPHRRAARPRPRPDVRHSAAGRERRVPARLRRSAAPDAPRRGAAGPHAGDPAGRAAAAVPRAARSTCARRCASRCPPAACRSTSC